MRRITSGVPFLGKAAEKGIHLVVEVIKGTWRTLDHHNEELDRKGDSDSVEFKCRFGQVF